MKLNFLLLLLLTFIVLITGGKTGDEGAVDDDQNPNEEGEEGGAEGDEDQQQEPDENDGEQGEQDNEEQAEGEQEEDDSLYIASLMNSHYKQFEDLSPSRKKKEFGKLIPTIDTNNDSTVSFDELHKFVLTLIEEDASNYDFSQLGIMDMDTDKDGKISWKEWEADQRKQLSDDGKLNYEEIGSTMKKEKIRFNYADKDKDGFISTKEIPRIVMSENFADMNEMAVDHYMLDLDADGNGLVDEAEFMKHARLNPNIEEDKLHFTLHDKNKDGMLSREELRDHALDNIAAPFIVRELKGIVAALDKNKDGTLTFEELEDGYEYFTDSKVKSPLSEQPRDEL